MENEACLGSCFILEVSSLIPSYFAPFCRCVVLAALCLCCLLWRGEINKLSVTKWEQLHSLTYSFITKLSNCKVIACGFASLCEINTYWRNWFSSPLSEVFDVIFYFIIVSSLLHKHSHYVFAWTLPAAIVARRSLLGDSQFASASLSIYFSE